MLGLGEKVVGVTDWCWHPADAVKHVVKIGGTKNASTKKIIALKPDLVIANHEENLRKHVERLRAADIPVWVTYARTVEEGLEEFRMLADLGAPDDAVEEFLVPCEEAFRSVQSLKENKGSAKSRSSFFCPIWKDPWMAVGGDTYCSDILEVCGGTNCFAGHERYPKVSDEEIIAAAPDVILLPSEPYEFAEEHRQELMKLPLPAAKSGRIHLIDGTLVSWYGPRVKEAIEVLRPLLEAR